MLVLHSAIMSNTKELATYREQHANPFGGNTASQTAYKRAERLSVAAHLITNFIPEHEPVRTQIRGKSLTLLENVLELREGFRTVGPERVNLVIAELLELTTLFEIANSAGYLSQMNVSVLQRACADLAHYLRQHEDSSESESLSLRENYFATSVSKKTPVRQDSIKDAGDSIRQRFLKDKTKGQIQRATPGKKTRHDAVLTFVQEKGRVSIKDVAEAVPGYSEKTIQRELLALVARGLVRKEGERRWSTYVLL